MTRIYTRSGDLGSTGLADGSRSQKDSLRIETIGSVDECNAHIGLLLSLLPDDEALRPVLIRVQHRLFDIGAALAAAKSALSQADIDLLENDIDTFDSTLMPLKQFILPGGNTAAASAHVARTICRRAERCIVALSKAPNERDKLPSEILRYMNRLSDLLFIIARVLAARDGGDVPWISKP